MVYIIYIYWFISLAQEFDSWKRNLIPATTSPITLISYILQILRGNCHRPSAALLVHLQSLALITRNLVLSQRSLSPLARHCPQHLQSLALMTRTLVLSKRSLGPLARHCPQHLQSLALITRNLVLSMRSLAPLARQVLSTADGLRWCSMSCAIWITESNRCSQLHRDH